MKNVFCTVLFVLFLSEVSFAEDELGMGAYQKDIGSSADAYATKIHDAWSESMANKVESGYADGIIIEGAADTDYYTSDGVGNVTVKDGANVGTIINKTDLRNTTVIITDSKKRY